MTDGPNKKSVTVRIAGEEHTIRASAEAEYTKSCARLVDERIAEIRSKAGLIEGYKAAILAALSITDQYFQARDELEEMRTRVGERADDLADRIRDRLADSAGAPSAASDVPRAAAPSASPDAGTGGSGGG